MVISHVTYVFSAACILKLDGLPPSSGILAPPESAFNTNSLSVRYLYSFTKAFVVTIPVSSSPEKAIIKSLPGTHPSDLSLKKAVTTAVIPSLSSPVPRPKK